MFDNFNSALDEMIKEVEQRIETNNRKIEQKLKYNPDALLRYKNACFKLEQWIKAHPFQNPPDAEYFLR